ncbi:MAG TPA: hypothetical protein VMB26_05220 [Candidatus Binataceae bacterium]|nr:hypothetical protein [Candidatus Binataceae bacterium]
MDRNEFLAWLGIIIAIPGFLLLFASRDWAIGILILLLIGAFAWFYWRSHRPPFTIKQISKTLEIMSDSGDLARLKRTQSAVANITATEFWCRNVGADGSIGNIRIDGQAPDEIVHELGRQHVCKRFRHPLKPRERFNLEVEYELVDSFPGSTEGLLHICDVRCDQIELKVIFRPARQPRNPRLFARYSGTETELQKPVQNGLTLQATIQRTRVGAEYELEWTW